MADHRPVLLVAVEPVVLEGAFAAILELIGVDEVVEFHGASAAERGMRYGAAIVSEAFADSVVADVVITLPGIPRSGGPTGGPRGQVTYHDVSEDVDIRGEREIIDLLDEHVPLPGARRGELLSSQRDGR